MKIKHVLAVLPVVALLTLAGCNTTDNSSSNGQSTTPTNPSTPSTPSNPSTPSTPSNPSSPSDSGSSGGDVQTPELPTNGEEVLELLAKSESTIHLVNYIHLEQPAYYVDVEYYFYDNDSYEASGMSFFDELGAYFGPLKDKENQYLDAFYLSGDWGGFDASVYTVGTTEEQQENPDIITQEDIDSRLINFLVNGNDDDFVGAVALVESFMDSEEYVNPGVVQARYEQQTKQIVVEISGGRYDYWYDEDYDSYDAYYESKAILVFEENFFLSSVQTSYVAYDINDVSVSFEIAEGATPLEENSKDVSATATQGERYASADGLKGYDPYEHIIPAGASVQVGKTVDNSFVETSTFIIGDTFAYQVTGSTDTAVETFSITSSDDSVIEVNEWYGEITIVGAGTTKLTFTSIYNTVEVNVTVSEAQSGGEDTETTKAELIVGSWTWDDDYVITFNEDKTGKVEDTWYETSASFNYEVDEETGAITFISETWEDDFKDIVGQSFHSAAISDEGVLTISIGAFGLANEWTKLS